MKSVKSFPTGSAKRSGTGSLAFRNRSVMIHAVADPAATAWPAVFVGVSGSRVPRVTAPGVPCRSGHRAGGFPRFSSGASCTSTPTTHRANEPAQRANTAEGHTRKAEKGKPKAR